MSTLAILQQDVVNTRQRLAVMARETLAVQMTGNAFVKYMSAPPKTLSGRFLSFFGIQPRFDLVEFESFLKEERKAVEAAVGEAQARAKVAVPPASKIIMPGR